MKFYKVKNILHYLWLRKSWGQGRGKPGEPPSKEPRCSVLLTWAPPLATPTDRTLGQPDLQGLYVLINPTKNLLFYSIKVSL